MSEDIAFRIQLGLILPKIKKSISSDLMKITEELVSVVEAGSMGEEKVDLAAVKTILMKDLEIFVDNEIFPVIDAKLNPPQEETDEEATAEAPEEVAEEEAAEA